MNNQNFIKDFLNRTTLFFNLSLLVSHKFIILLLMHLFDSVLLIVMTCYLLDILIELLKKLYFAHYIISGGENYKTAHWNVFQVFLHFHMSFESIRYSIIIMIDKLSRLKIYKFLHLSHFKFCI